MIQLIANETGITMVHKVLFVLGLLRSEWQGEPGTLGVGWRRAGQLHQLEEDPPAVQNEGKQEVCPGVEENKVADQGLQDEQRPSLCVFSKDLRVTVGVPQAWTKTLFQRSRRNKDWFSGQWCNPAARSDGNFPGNDHIMYIMTSLTRVKDNLLLCVPKWQLFTLRLI